MPTNPLSPEIERILDEAARELHDRTKYGTFSSHTEVITAFGAVLRLKLRPLLEGGKAMRDWMFDDYEAFSELQETWDAAWQAALGEEPSHGLSKSNPQQKKDT